MELLADRLSATTTTMRGGPVIGVELASFRAVHHESTAVVVDRGRV